MYLHNLKDSINTSYLRVGKTLFIKEIPHCAIGGALANAKKRPSHFLKLFPGLL